MSCIGLVPWGVRLWPTSQRYNKKFKALVSKVLNRSFAGPGHMTFPPLTRRFAIKGKAPPPNLWPTNRNGQNGSQRSKRSERPASQIWCYMLELYLIVTCFVVIYYHWSAIVSFCCQPTAVGCDYSNFALQTWSCRPSCRFSSAFWAF